MNSRSLPARLESSRRSWLLLAMVSAFAGITSLAAALIAQADDWWMHGLWCVVFGSICLIVLVRELRGGVGRVLSDHRLMFLAAFVFYFCIGASFMAFGNEAEISRVLRYYHVDAPLAMRANAVNALGLAIALCAATLFPSGWARRSADMAATTATRIPFLLAISIFGLVGLLASLYMLGNDLGFQADIVPGIVRNVAQLTLIAVFLACSYGGRSTAIVRGGGILLGLFLSLTGMITFSKTQMLLPLAAVIGGLAWARKSRSTLVVGSLLLLALFVATSDPVAYARNTLGDRVAAVPERLALFSDGFGAAQVRDPLAEASPWGRLSYVTSQGAGMDFYDQGIGANDFALIPWLFVPRLLAPDKPVITETPRTFHEKISGHRGSSTGQGIFSTGYYSGGWLGVVLAALLSGIVLSQTSAIASAVLARRAVFLLPFALYGVFIAFRIDGSFLSDYLGAFVFILYPMIAYRFARFITRSPRVEFGRR